MQKAHHIANGMAIIERKGEIGTQMHYIASTHSVRSADAYIMGESADAIGDIISHIALLFYILGVPMVALCHGACQCHGMIMMVMALNEYLGSGCNPCAALRGADQCHKEIRI